MVLVFPQSKLVQTQRWSGRGILFVNVCAKRLIIKLVKPKETNLFWIINVIVFARALIQGLVIVIKMLIWILVSVNVRIQIMIAEIRLNLLGILTHVSVFANPTLLVPLCNNLMGILRFVRVSVLVLLVLLGRVRELCLVVLVGAGVGILVGLSIVWLMVFGLIVVGGVVLLLLVMLILLSIIKLVLMLMIRISVLVLRVLFLLLVLVLLMLIVIRIVLGMISGMIMLIVVLLMMLMFQ
jgi:hypothetical protein